MKAHHKSTTKICLLCGDEFIGTVSKVCTACYKHVYGMSLKKKENQDLLKKYMEIIYDRPSVAQRD